MRKLRYVIGDSFDGKRAQAFLRHIGCSSAIISELKKDDRLTANGAKIRTIDILHSGDELCIFLKDESGIPPNPELAVPLAYEDGDVAVFDKPAGMPVHPSPNHYGDTLANYFSALYPDCVFRSVNRLDKNTSGLCVTAKNKLSGCVTKKYYAFVGGKIGSEGDCGNITAPIARAEGSLIGRTVRDDGQFASTDYRVLFSCERLSFLEISLNTGRTHQIRVHFSHIGFPLLGDDLYGGDCTDIQRHALHCGEVSFSHPISGESICVKSELPEDMAGLAAGCGYRR